jgi:hemoglobin
MRMTESTFSEDLPLSCSVGSKGEMLMSETHRRRVPNFGAAGERSWRRTPSLSLVWVIRRAFSAAVAKAAPGRAKSPVEIFTGRHAVELSKPEGNRMKASFVVFAAVIALLCPWTSSSAQGADSSATQAPRDDALYRALGELPGIKALIGVFIVQIVSDPRLLPFFRNAKPEHINKQLVSQVCELTGGPCVYQGPDMATAHENFTITAADFNALVEALQRAMNQRGIDFSTQNRLLALLTPMNRDIVNSP